MEVKTILDLAANYGIGLLCVAYMIYFQFTTMKDLQKTQEAMLTALNNMNHRLELIESKIEKRGEE